MASDNKYYVTSSIYHQWAATLIVSLSTAGKYNHIGNVFEKCWGARQIRGAWQSDIYGITSKTEEETDLFSWVGMIGRRGSSKAFGISRTPPDSRATVGQAENTMLIRHPRSEASHIVESY